MLKPVLDAEGNVIDNEWDIDGIGDFFTYMGNMTAVSLPYMGVTAAGALTAPVGMIAPASMYTGMTWNDMEGENKDKSATLAVAGGLTMTVLDRLGITLLMGKVPGTLLSPRYRKVMVKKWMKKNPGKTEAQGREAIANMTRMAAAELIGSATKVAKGQLTYGNIIRSFAARAGMGFGIESSTEVGQELTQYLAATMGSDKPFDSIELNNRLVNALVAGGTLGAGFTIPGTAVDVGQWTDVNVRAGPSQDKRMSTEQKWHEEENSHRHDRYREGDVIPPDKKVGDIKPGGKFKLSKSKSIQDNMDDYRKGAKKRKATAKRRAVAQEKQINILRNQLTLTNLTATQRNDIQQRIKELEELKEQEAKSKMKFEDKVEAGRKQYKARDYWEKFKAAANNLPV